MKKNAKEILLEIPSFSSFYAVIEKLEIDPAFLLIFKLNANPAVDILRKCRQTSDSRFKLLN